jgi:hypothetical protein
MEAIVTVITLLFLIVLILSPIVLIRFVNKLNIRFKFIVFLIIGLVLMFSINFVFAWWSYTSDMILLKYYGYNIDGMSEQEFYGNVLPENMEKVRSLEISIMGIGWPLKAILSSIFYSPFLLLVYFLNYLTSRIKKS